MVAVIKLDLFVVDDLISGFIKLMNSDQSGPINLGNTKEHKIIELLNL